MGVDSECLSSWALFSFLLSILSLQLHVQSGITEQKGQKQLLYQEILYSQPLEYLSKGWEVQAKFSENRRKISSHMPTKCCWIKKEQHQELLAYFTRHMCGLVRVFITVNGKWKELPSFSQRSLTNSLWIMVLKTLLENVPFSSLASMKLFWAAKSAPRGRFGA